MSNQPPPGSPPPPPGGWGDEPSGGQPPAGQPPQQPGWGQPQPPPQQPPPGQQPGWGQQPPGPQPPPGQQPGWGQQPPGPQPPPGQQPGWGQQPPPGGSPYGQQGYGYGGPASQKVGPWPRLGARILDGLILLIPGLIISALFGGATVGTGTFSTDDLVASFFASLVTTLIGMAYFVYLESNNGRTPGKAALNMRIVGPQGGNVTMEQSFKRNAWYLLGLIPIVGGLASLIVVIVIAVGISSDPRGQGPHDRFAGGTLVYREG